MARRKEPVSSVQSVDRALRILDLLASEGRSLGLGQISEMLGLNASTTHRLLTALMIHGYVEQQKENDKYRLGFKVLELSSALLQQIDLRQEAYPYLRELMERTGEVVHLAILDQGEVVYIDKVESIQTLTMYSKIGRRVYCHCTALGKVLLASLDDREIEEILSKKGLPRLTNNTITSLEQFYLHLQTVRANGFAIDDEEHEQGIRCVAAPIYNQDGRVVAALSVSGPSIRMTREKIERVTPLVTECGGKISERLGYRSRIGTTDSIEAVDLSSQLNNGGARDARSRHTG
ncbi:MAG: IclR family transcriptional regulator [Firmicutes bacterium]|nr:IclR family transcriptional regulator [Bacillota bacterium]